MAIFYYDDIDLATNQLLDVSLEIVADVDNIAAADNFTGRIAFDQATDTFSFYNGTEWVDLTGTGGVEAVYAQDGVKIDTTTGDVTLELRYQTNAPHPNFIAEATNGGGLNTTDGFLAYQSTQDPLVSQRSISEILALITSTGGVEEIEILAATDQSGSAPYVPLTLDEPNPEEFTITPRIYKGGDKVGYVPSNADVGSTYFLRGDGLWVVPENDLGIWTISDNESPPVTQAVPNGTTIDFDGGIGINSDAGSIGVVAVIQWSLDLTDNSLEVADGGTLATDSIVYSEYGVDTNIKGEISDAPLNALGTANADLSMTTSGTAYKITGLDTDDPDTGSDIVDKKFVDDTAGEVFNFQGGYNASSNSPDLTSSPNSITKGQAWAVTDAGTFYGEQLRDGDFLIANDDDPSQLSDWEVVQSNIGLAENNVFGIGYYTQANGFEPSMTAGEPKLDAVANDVGTFGAADKSITLSTDEFGRVTDIAANDIVLPASASDIANDLGQITDFNAEVSADINAKSFIATVGGQTMTVVHNLGTKNVRVQAYRNSGLRDTINFRVERYDTNTVKLYSQTTLGANSVQVLVQECTTP
jgi:hypothetical protein